MNGETIVLVESRMSQGLFLLFTFADSVFSLEMILKGKDCNNNKKSQQVVVITFSCSEGEGVVRIDITVIGGFCT